MAVAAAIAVLALVAASAGMLVRGGDGAHAVTTLRGEAVEVYGSGLYRHDTLFTGAGNRGTDAAVLALGIPLLVIATALHRRGSRRGALLLAGTLVCFLYVYGSYALGVSYQRLFPVYIALFSASLFAFVQCFVALARATPRLSPRLPRRGIGWFMVISGLVTVAVWMLPLAGAVLRNEPPERLDLYTTSVTDVLDLGVIAPASLLAGALLLRGVALGYLVAVSLVVLEVMLAPLIAAQTLSQLAAGVEFAAAEVIGPMAGFCTISLAALWALTQCLRHADA